MGNTTVRLTRATRFLPAVRGIGRVLAPAQAISRYILHTGLHRISDFDGDLKLDVDPREHMGGILWHIPQLYERHERALFCSAVKPGMTVLDVGANLGIYSFLAAKRGARVLAIEADPENTTLLRHNVSLNGFGDSITVMAMAASDHEHTVDIHRNPRNSGGSLVVPGSSVPAHTIDSLALPYVDVCKLDVEGYEARVLSGMSETLRRSPTIKLLLEYNCRSDQTALFNLVRSLFSHIAIPGKGVLQEGQLPPDDCNLWVWNR